MLNLKNIIKQIESNEWFWRPRTHEIQFYEKLNIVPEFGLDENGQPLGVMENCSLIRSMDGIWQITQMPAAGWWEIPNEQWFQCELERLRQRTRMSREAIEVSRYHNETRNPYERWEEVADELDWSWLEFEADESKIKR